MATPIVIGSGYFNQFASGQGAVPVADYTAFAADLDTNFTLLAGTINSLVAEVKAITGPNALFGQDVMFLDDPTIVTISQTGRIGVSPVTLTINGGNAALLDLSAGAMALAGVRTDVVAQQVAGAGLGGAPVSPAYIAMDVNGVISVSATPGSQIFDVYEAVWDGAVFTSVTDQLHTFLDGDEWYEMRTEPAATPFVAGQYRGAHSRLDNYSRYLGGFTTNTDGQAISGQIIGGGSNAAVRIGLGDGAGVIDTNTGFFRPAANILRYAVAGVDKFQLVANGAQVANGSAGSPSWSFISDPDTGLYRHAADELGFVANGADVLLLRENQARAGIAGSAATPFWSCDVANRDTSGMYFPADDELGLGTNGTEGFRMGAAQVVSLPAQPAGHATRLALQSIPDNTATALLFTDADLFDVTGQHDNVTNSDRVTIGTGEGGVYVVHAQSTFDESTGSGASANRRLEITVNGTTRGRSLTHGDGTNDEGLEASCVVSLVATDIVRAVVLQDSGGAMDVVNSRISWGKIA